jgi:hypothetical protein
MMAEVLNYYRFGGFDFRRQVGPFLPAGVILALSWMVSVVKAFWLEVHLLDHY